MADPLILGVDPGAGGALAWVSPGGHLIAVADMPVLEVRGKRRVVAGGLATLMVLRPIRLVVIEGVNAMPNQGVSSSFWFGYAAGVVEGVAAGLGLPTQIIRAATWKRRAGVGSDKGAVRQMASRLWPGAASQFVRVRDDGRAEASLLACWTARGGHLGAADD